MDELSRRAQLLARAIADEDLAPEMAEGEGLDLGEFLYWREMLVRALDFGFSDPFHFHKVLGSSFVEYGPVCMKGLSTEEIAEAFSIASRRRLVDSLGLVERLLEAGAELYSWLPVGDSPPSSLGEARLPGGHLKHLPPREAEQTFLTALLVSRETMRIASPLGDAEQAPKTPKRWGGKVVRASGTWHHLRTAKDYCLCPTISTFQLLLETQEEGALELNSVQGVVSPAFDDQSWVALVCEPLAELLRDLFPPLRVRLPSYRPKPPKHSPPRQP